MNIKSKEQLQNLSKKEVWRDIKGYEGRYQVSNMGRVKSLERTVVGKNGSKYHKKGRILKPWSTKDGYLRVQLRNTSGKKKCSVFIALSALHFTKILRISLA